MKNLSTQEDHVGNSYENIGKTIDSIVRIPPPNPLIPAKRKREIQKAETNSGYPYELLEVVHQGKERENEKVQPG